jgi:hypothetical protein
VWWTRLWVDFCNVLQKQWRTLQMLMFPKYKVEGLGFDILWEHWIFHLT